MHGGTTTVTHTRRLHPSRPTASGIDIFEAILGIWLFVSAPALNQNALSHDLEPLFNNMVVGAVLILGGILAATTTSSTISVARPLRHRQWSLFTLALSAWLLVSPWLLGYTDDTGVAANDAVCALVLAALSLVNLRLTSTLGHSQHSGFVTSAGDETDSPV